MTHSQGSTGNNSVVNTCAKSTLNDTQPDNSEACVAEKNENCCFVNTGSKKYCTLIDGGLHDDVIDELKETLGLTQLEIVCNESHYIKFTFAIIFLALFLF